MCIYVLNDVQNYGANPSLIRHLDQLSRLQRWFGTGEAVIEQAKEEV
jgi:hypothetical protein